jgi:oxygen-independent coproporphyrinogen-3 oxidase
MCHLETEWNVGLTESQKAEILSRLDEMFEDDLIESSGNKLIVKEKGRMFVRNICMAFDLRLIENKPQTRIFSMTI